MRDMDERDAQQKRAVVRFGWSKDEVGCRSASGQRIWSWG
jgi:hypothetical protein